MMNGSQFICESCILIIRLLNSKSTVSSNINMDKCVATHGKKCVSIVHKKKFKNLNFNLGTFIQRKRITTIQNVFPVLNYDTLLLNQSFYFSQLMHLVVSLT